MKKLVASIKKRRKGSKPSSTRITNETVAEHRERILAGGRRFKYPVQYTKNRLVMTALLLGILAVVLFLTVTWWQLYRSQTTDSFFYRLTRIVPLPVAVIDGESVHYGDYLLNYKISETYLDTVEKANEAKYADGGSNQSQYDYYKAQAMRNAISDSYAAKLARSQGVTISQAQLDEAITRLRQTASSQGEISQEAYDRSAEQLYGLSPSDNRYYLQKRLLRQAVSYKIDTTAREMSAKIQKALAANPTVSFDTLVNEQLKKPQNVQVLTSGWVSKDNKDGGLAAAAAKLKKDEISGPIKPLNGDGYYFVKLLDTNKDGEVNYQFIKVALQEFRDRLANTIKSQKVSYYITVPEMKPQVQATSTK